MACVNPADLAELLRATATAVLSEHALDTAALPATVTVERPRNPEHGDYASNLALQLGKKVGVNPRDLAGWLADALAQADGIASAEIAGPALSTCGWTPRRKASSSTTSSTPATPTETPTRKPTTTSTSNSSPPTRPAPSTSAAPGGRPSATRWAGCSRPKAPTWYASTTSMTTAPRSTGSPTR
jgi:hypothetical protein